MARRGETLNDARPAMYESGAEWNEPTKAHACGLPLADVKPYFRVRFPRVKSEIMTSPVPCDAGMMDLRRGLGCASALHPSRRRPAQGDIVRRNGDALAAHGSPCVGASTRGSARRTCYTDGGSSAGPV
jgi:hypothetical protein